MQNLYILQGLVPQTQATKLEFAKSLDHNRNV